MRYRRTIAFARLLPVLLATGCPSTALVPFGDDLTDAALRRDGAPRDGMRDGLDQLPPPPDFAFPVAGHPPLPQIPFGGGATLNKVALVTVVWPNDSLASPIAAFDRWLPMSAYWTGTLAEYGIGAGTPSTVSISPSAAPSRLDDAEIRKLLVTGVNQGRLPAVTDSRLYDVYPPAATTVTASLGGVSGTGCVDFSGYHSAIATPRGMLYYTVVPRCAPSGGLDALGVTTLAASHEIAEAATDPSALVDTAGWLLSASDSSDPFGGEIGDLCRGYVVHADGYAVTALWSNRAAAAQQRPCVPAPSGPLFGAVLQPSALDVAVGNSAAANLTVYATGPLPARLILRGVSLSPSLIDVTLRTATAQNGDQLPFTVSASRSAVSGAYYLIAFTLSSADYHMDDYLIIHIP